MAWDVRPVQRKAEDAHRQRLKAKEMLRLARQTPMPEVAEELIEMARLLHESAQKAEAQIASAPPQQTEKIRGS